MSERKFDQFSNLGHLFPTTTDIIVADVVEVALFILTLDGFTLAVDDGVLGDDAVRWRVNLDHLELHLSHTAAHGEEIILPQWAIGLAEVRSQEDVKERARDTLDRVCDRKDCNPFGLRRMSNCHHRSLETGTYIFDVRARMNRDDIAMLDAQVVSDDPVHASAAIIEFVIGEDNQHGIFSLLALDEDSISAKELESLHGIIRQGDDRVVIVDGIGNTAETVSTEIKACESFSRTYINAWP